MGQAIFIARTGGPEVLEARPHEAPAPGPGQARVRIAWAGVNFIDTYQRSGAYPRPLPFISGLEGSGTVEAVGEGVRDLPPGARVAWASVPGSYASEVLAPVAALVPVPDALALDLAAAAMLQGMTAHYLVHGVRETRAGDTALVHAAAGGTGQLLVQLLKRAGARVIATCSTEAKAQVARAAGADEIVRYDQVDFSAEARRATDGRGVDVVYDSVGKTTFDGSLRSLRARGLCVLFGQASGPVPPFDLQRLNQGGGLFVTRPSLAHYTASRAELEQRSHFVLSALAQGWLRVAIDRRLPLAQAAEAHRALEGRETSGKILLQV